MLLSIFSSVVAVCGFFVWIVAAGDARSAHRESEYVSMHVMLPKVCLIAIRLLCNTTIETKPDWI